jgi:hypothetical protein
VRTVEIAPQTALVTLQSDPAGLNLAFGSGVFPTPFQRQVIVGSSFSVAAPSEQAHAGGTWAFQSWSNGGARQHNAVASSPGSLVLTARYRQKHTFFEDGFEGATAQ